MSFLEVVTIVGVIAVAGLIAVYLKLRQSDVIAALMEKRRGSSRVVSRAEYVEGVEMLPVALALTDKALHYENADLEASFDLDRLDEIEYAEDLATGKSLHKGCGVLRLRSHGATFEFVLDQNDCAKWQAALPPRSYGNVAHAV